jgi:hypothetical protein
MEKNAARSYPLWVYAAPSQAEGTVSGQLWVHVIAPVVGFPHNDPEGAVAAAAIRTTTAVAAVDS